MTTPIADPVGPQAPAACDDREQPSATIGGLPTLAVTQSACLARIDRLGWAHELVAVRSGSHVLGVRVSDPRLLGPIHELLAPRVVEGGDAERNLSLKLAPRTSDGVQDLHHLYRVFVPELRCRSVRRTLSALVHELDVRDARLERQPLVDAAILIGRGQAHLLPGELRRGVVRDQRAWERGGLQLLERRQATLDLDEGVVVVPDTGVGSLWVRALVAELDLDDDGSAAVAPGRYPIASWTAGPDAGSLAARVGLAATQLVDRGRTVHAAGLGSLGGWCATGVMVGL